MKSPVLLSSVLSVALLSACGGGKSPSNSVFRADDAACADIVMDFSGTAPTAVEGVVIPPGDFASHSISLPTDCAWQSLQVVLSWDIELEDLDLALLDAGGTEVASSGNFNALEGAAQEVVSIGAPVGDYTVVVKSYANVETPYELSVSISPADSAVSPLESAPQDVAAVVDGTAKPRTVVAAIDSGINMYHSHWYAGSPIYQEQAPQAVTAPLLKEFGVGPDCIMELTRTGNFAADYQADVERGEWDKALLCKVVWFKDTNVLASSFNAGTVPIMPDNEDDTHGTGVSASVLNANPEAVLYFLEGIGEASEVAAFSHPAVDFVTTSFGPVGSVPLPGNLKDSFKGVYENGMLHFGACDNTPALAQGDSTCGPWWSIGIAGFEETAENEPETSSSGRQSVSGNFPDFVADFTQTLPYCQACEEGYEDYVAGTSFATPRSAGIASRILLLARRAVGQVSGINHAADTPLMVDAGGVSISNWQLRRALEEAAWVPGLNDYDPIAAAFEYGPGYPIPPVAPWLVISWGVLSAQDEAGVIDGTLAHLGLGGEPVFKASDYCSFNSSNIQARKLYWDTVNVGSETFMNAPNPDPYIGC